MKVRSVARTPENRSSRPGLRLWWTAIRPRTLTMAFAPVVVGSVLAWSEGAGVDWPTALVALSVALAIQAGTNLFNDVGDAGRGNDGVERVGPPRVTATGAATPQQVRNAAIIAFAAAFVGGGYLVFVGGWPILLIGLLSLYAGWKYSGGARPLSHTAWGELYVMLFFGVVAVAGSHYLQSGRLAASALLVGCALGAQAAAVLMVNNVRDLEADNLAGRRTMAAVLGVEMARRVYVLLMLVPFMLLSFLSGPTSLGVVWLALPPCLWLAWVFLRIPPGRGLNLHLVRTAQAQVLLAILLSAHLLL